MMTLAEQRLNSNHGRLIRAAQAVPARLRYVAIESGEWTPRDLLAHVLAWQEEALRRFRNPQTRCLNPQEIDAWNQMSREQMADLRWDEIMVRIEAAHRALKQYLGEEPPSWFAACTYRHYTEHTRTLRSLAQSLTVTVAPIAAQL